MAESGVGTPHRARPQPGDDGEILPQQRLQVRPLGDHLGGDFDLGVEVADALLRLRPHPSTIAAHVLGQALGAGPVLDQLALPLALRQRADRRPVGEAWRDLDHGLVDGHRHRVEVGGPGLQPQPLGLQWQGTAAGEGVMKGRQLVRVEEFGRLRVALVQRAGLTPAFPDLRPGAGQHFLVVGVLP